MKKKINVLIIGGSGYVGSRLCEYLINKNKINITNIDLKLNLHKTITKKLNYNKLEIKFLKKFDYVIILAAHSSTNQCLDDKIGAIKNNITDLLDLLIKIKSSKVVPIFISTTAVYNNLKKPGFESQKIKDKNLLNLYDISKRFIEKYIEKNLIKYYILRLGTVSGRSPIQDKRLIINRMFFDSKKYNKIFTVSEKSRKSILFIGDFCKSIELILLTKKHNYGIYNLNSINMTVKQIANKISNLKKVKIKKKLGKSGYSFFSSNQKFTKIFKMKFANDIKIILNDLDNF